MAFIDDHRDRFGVEPVCRVLTEHGVPIAPSGYYAARTRGPSARELRDAAMLAEIRRVYHDRRLGRGVDGARKVWLQLRREGGVDGRQVPRFQVERLMRIDGLRGAPRSRSVVTTRVGQTTVRPPDLVHRDFTATRPNALWVVDFTYVATWSGTAFVSDVYSRRVVGWRTAGSMPTELPLDALEMALWTRQRAGRAASWPGWYTTAIELTQYTAIRYANRLLDAGALASIGTVGDSYDNALAESVTGLYKTERIGHDGPFRGIDDLELATLDWVDWFNHHRLHSSIGDVPPTEFETLYYRQHHTDQQPLAAEPSLH